MRQKEYPQDGCVRNLVVISFAMKLQEAWVDFGRVTSSGKINSKLIKAFEYLTSMQSCKFVISFLYILHTCMAYTTFIAFHVGNNFLSLDKFVPSKYSIFYLLHVV